MIENDNQMKHELTPEESALVTLILEKLAETPDEDRPKALLEMLNTLDWLADHTKNILVYLLQIIKIETA